MKSYLFCSSFALFLLLFLLQNFVSTAQDFQWARRGGSTNNLQATQDYNNVIDMVADASDNVYLLCRVGANNLQVDGHALQAYSSVGIGASRDILLTSFTKEGIYRWSKVLGGVSGDDGIGLKVQGSRVYLSGLIYSNDSARYSTDTIVYRPYNSAYWPKHAFLINYDTSGVFQWLHMPGSDTISKSEFPEQPYWIDVAANGDVYWLISLVPGSLPNTAQPVTQKGTYVVRYSSSGQYLSRVKLDADHYGQAGWNGTLNEGNFIRDPQTGNFYLGGTHDMPGDVIIGGDTIRGAIYLACFDNTGQLLWKKESKATKSSFNITTTNLNDFELDANGDLLLTGTSRSGDTLFDGLVASSTNTSVSPLVMKMSSSGNVLWHKMGVVQGVGYSFGLAQYGNEVAIAGSHVGIHWQGANDLDTLHSVPNQGYDAYIARFDQQTGDLLGMQSAETNFGSHSYGYSITADSEGGYYLGGNYSAQLYLGPDTLYKIGSQRSFFVTKYGCTMPEANFTQSLDSSAYVFAYTGTPADSVHWDFGDGSPIATGDTVAYTYSAAGQYVVCATAYDASCGDTTFCDTVDVMKVSLRDQNRREVAVYPNPTDGGLSLKSLPEQGWLSLYNFNGKLMMHQAITNKSTQLDLSSLPNGVYLLGIENAEGVKIFRKVLKD